MILGLGNPGKRYSLNRHNIGFQVLDKLAEGKKRKFRKPFFADYSMVSLSSEAGPIFFIKPLTYMNHSGKILTPLFRRTGLGLEDVLVICDHLDLPTGVCRLKRRGSSGGHRGLQSIISECGSEDFLRLYIGIGRPEGAVSVREYVLGDPLPDEQIVLGKAIQKASEAALQLLTVPPEKVMNELNRKE